MSVPSPKHTDPGRRPWYGNKLALVFGSIGAVVVLCLSGLTITGLFLPDPPPKPPKAKSAATRPAAPTATAATSSAPSPPAATAAPASPPGRAPAPDSVYCKVTVGGTYYLKVTSATVHNFRACDGAEPYSGTTDDLFKLPHMDRRCTLGLDYTSREGALVAVYSDTAAANLAAAKEFCDANGGTL